MIAKLQQHIQYKYVLLFSVVIFVLGVGALITQAATPEEFTLTIPANESPTWNILQGVGTRIQYPATWHGRAYQAQGGVRNGATYEFTWTDAHSQTIRIEMLEIVSMDTGQLAQTTELAYWQQYGIQKGYRLEKVLVQGAVAWWLQPATPSAAPATLWVATGARVYRFRVHDNTTTDAGTRRLRQMLTTLESTPIDWQHAPKFSIGTETSNVQLTTVITTGVPYQRNAAFDYAQTYYDQLTNADDCYLWFDGSTLDCTYHTDDVGVDGAHFVNQTVNAGERPIPGLWNGAATQVAALRDWLQSDGWYTVTTTQAQIGDVAFIGPWDAPCWTGVVVASGNNPTLATHSDEYWLVASELYCFSGGEQTYTKTYLHTDVTFANHLPLVMRIVPTPTPSPTPTPTPQPKIWTGTHLGNRHWTGWTEDMLAVIDPTQQGNWPSMIVVLSNQIYNIQRDATCEITGVEVRHTVAHNYLQRAADEGEVKVVIRIYPSPGNFEESIMETWPDLATRPNTRTLITEPGILAGIPSEYPYCAENRFRSLDDVGDEILAIQEASPWIWGFQPAGEPNIEWYWNDRKPDVRPQPSFYDKAAWHAMDVYFANLYDYVHGNAGTLTVRVLTPPMAQSTFAETNEVNSETCPPFAFSGYAEMTRTINSATPKNDGYSWNNYWHQTRESWATCPDGQHISMWFPDQMENNILNNVRPGVITEADLFSPYQSSQALILNKDEMAGEPAATSIRLFLSEEYNAGMADAIALWLLTDETDPEADYDRAVEHQWHQMYTPTLGIRPWFTELWFNPEE